jgi:hypothetical protein
MRAFVGVVEAKSSELDKFNREGEQEVVEQDAVIATKRAPLAKPANDQQPAVALSVSKDDPTILTALIDRTASQKRILNDLRRALPDFAVPYRELEPGIVEAIRRRIRENITFQEASIWVFGTPDLAGRIRYWRNRWGLQ